MSGSQPGRAFSDTASQRSNVSSQGSMGRRLRGMIGEDLPPNRRRRGVNNSSRMDDIDVADSSDEDRAEIVYGDDSILSEEILELESLFPDGVANVVSIFKFVSYVNGAKRDVSAPSILIRFFEVFGKKDMAGDLSKGFDFAKIKKAKRAMDQLYDMVSTEMYEIQRQVAAGRVELLDYLMQLQTQFELHLNWLHMFMHSEDGTNSGLRLKTRSNPSQLLVRLVQNYVRRNRLIRNRAGDFCIHLKDSLGRELPVLTLLRDSPDELLLDREELLQLKKYMLVSARACWEAIVAEVRQVYKYDSTLQCQFTLALKPVLDALPIAADKDGVFPVVKTDNEYIFFNNGIVRVYTVNHEPLYDVAYKGTDRYDEVLQRLVADGVCARKMLPHDFPSSEHISRVKRQMAVEASKHGMPWQNLLLRQWRIVRGSSSNFVDYLAERNKFDEITTMHLYIAIAVASLFDAYSKNKVIASRWPFFAWLVGAAGTGKTSLLDFISSFWNPSQILRVSTLKQSEFILDGIEEDTKLLAIDETDDTLLRKLPMVALNQMAESQSLDISQKMKGNKNDFPIGFHSIGCTNFPEQVFNGEDVSHGTTIGQMARRYSAYVFMTQFNSDSTPFPVESYTSYSGDVAFKGLMALQLYWKYMASNTNKQQVYYMTSFQFRMMSYLMRGSNPLRQWFMNCSDLLFHPKARMKPEDLYARYISDSPSSKVMQSSMPDFLLQLSNLFNDIIVLMSRDGTVDSFAPADHSLPGVNVLDFTNLDLSRYSVFDLGVSDDTNQVDESCWNPSTRQQLNVVNQEEVFIFDKLVGKGRLTRTKTGREAKWIYGMCLKSQQTVQSVQPTPGLFVTECLAHCADTSSLRALLDKDYIVGLVQNEVKHYWTRFASRRAFDKVGPISFAERSNMDPVTKWITSSPSLLFGEGLCCNVGELFASFCLSPESSGHREFTDRLQFVKQLEQTLRQLIMVRRCDEVQAIGRTQEQKYEEQGLAHMDAPLVCELLSQSKACTFFCYFAVADDDIDDEWVARRESRERMQDILWFEDMEMSLLISQEEISAANSLNQLYVIGLDIRSEIADRYSVPRRLLSNSACIRIGAERDMILAHQREQVIQEKLRRQRFAEAEAAREYDEQIAAEIREDEEHGEYVDDAATYDGHTPVASGQLDESYGTAEEFSSDDSDESSDL